MTDGGEVHPTNMRLEGGIYHRPPLPPYTFYNVPGMIDVDTARFQLFINTYLAYGVSEEFNRKNVKNFDASNLPTCKSELLQQFRRANYITILWSNTHMKGLSIFSPENNRGTLEDNQHFNWFDGDQLSAFVSESFQDESVILLSL
ncbi:uncharacterized protein TNCV_3905061 [Trichonephila clavipes]|nr:uncharacterized protein TNCV_3905061 [Trichonephila clavipes]